LPTSRPPVTALVSPASPVSPPLGVFGWLAEEPPQPVLASKHANAIKPVSSPNFVIPSCS
jgi:hypothetical protein